MTRISLLNAVCTVAMLAAVPTLAQAQRADADAISPNGVLNPDVKQPKAGPLAPQHDGANATSMAPTRKTAATMTPPPSTDTTADPTKAKMSTSRHAMKESRPEHAMHGKTDTSQDAAVDRLNDQSYQAAEKGQMFAATGSSTSMMKPSGATKMSTPPSGAMTNPTK